MTGTVLLNNVVHADLRVATGYAARYGDAVNQCAVFPTEFEEAHREYPILFRKDAHGAFYSVVLLGLDRDENLFLSDDGWHARHVPAVHQRGAFKIGMVDRGAGEREAMIHVDLDHPRIGATNGAAVFLPHGGHSPYLEHIVRILQVIHDGLMQREAMFAAFLDADLIEPIGLDIALDDATRYEVPDCYTISTTRLAGMDGATLASLNRAGFLRHAFLVASSLGNVSQLIALKNRLRSGSVSTSVAA